LFWVKGNNEDFDFVTAQPPGSGTISNLHYIPNGFTVQAPGDITLAGLGGTFAPTWYERSPGELPANAKDDKRRHFVREEVEACKRLSGVDVFLSHEAARPFLLHPQRKSGSARPIDAGKTPVNEVLAAMKPRLHVFGHHHIYAVTERQHVPSICLEMASTSYLVFDAKSLAHRRLTR
jgi:Icc-related predicted phosphoesterase